MSCICYGGNKESVSYVGITAAFGGTRDGSTLRLCPNCDGKISSAPTTRETLYREGRLGWQSDSMPEPDIDFATAISSAYPAALTELDDEDGGITLRSAAPAALPANGGAEPPFCAVR
jgi:hypothetical protein